MTEAALNQDIWVCSRYRTRTEDKGTVRVKSRCKLTTRRSGVWSILTSSVSFQTSPTAPPSARRMRRRGATRPAGSASLPLLPHPRGRRRRSPPPDPRRDGDPPTAPPLHMPSPRRLRRGAPNPRTWDGTSGKKPTDRYNNRQKARLQDTVSSHTSLLLLWRLHLLLYQLELSARQGHYIVFCRITVREKAKETKRETAKMCFQKL